MNFWDKKAEAEARIDTLNSRCSAVLAAAEKTDRTLTAAEREQFDSDLAEIKSERTAIEKLRDQRDAKLATARRESIGESKPNFFIKTPNQGQTMTQNIQHLGKLNAFEDHEQATAAGCWFIANVARAKGGIATQAENYLQDYRGGILAQHVEGTDSLGGYTVPQEWNRAIINVMDRVGVARQTARIYPMGSEILHVPKMTAGLTVEYPGEATAITDSVTTWSEVLLTAVKRAVLTKMSNELRMDNIVGLIDILVQDMGYQLALNQDREYLIGDGAAGSGGVTGLIPSLGVGGTSTAVASWSATEMSDFTDLQALLPSKYNTNTSWICSSEYYHGVMQKLQAEAGGNTMMSLEAGASRPLFLGRPVYTSSHMPAATAAGVSLLYGTFTDAAALGDRMAIQIATSEHLDFSSDMLAIRGVSRYDIKVHEPGDASNAGAYVGLDYTA